MGLRIFFVLVSSLAFSLAARTQELSHYDQIYAGFNGPKNPHTFVFYSAEDVRKSWVALALPTQLDSVLSKVNFKHQVLVAAAVGERATANGALHIARIDVYQSIVTPYVQIGVNDLGCNEAHAHSYPFVLAVIEKPEKTQSLSGYDHQNYPNSCSPAAAGAINDPT